MSKELRDLTEKLTRPPAVLVVEGDSTTRSFLKRLVQQIQPESSVTEAADGHEALQALKVSQFDIVFLDLIMPVASGYDVLETMDRKSNPLVAVITGLDDETSIRRCKSLGAFVVLIKPITREDIAFVLCSAVAR